MPARLDAPDRMQVVCLLVMIATAFRPSTTEAIKGENRPSCVREIEP